ncbi:MAG: hypothetical protein AAB393_13360, partial [Bacteroidota bacterium]
MKYVGTVTVAVIVCELLLGLFFLPSGERDFWRFVALHTFGVKPLFAVSLILSLVYVLKAESKGKGTALLAVSVGVYVAIAGVEPDVPGERR